MKVLIIIGMCLYVASALPQKTNPRLDDEWQEYKGAYGKVYDPQFEYVRRMIWEQNLEKIQSHNLKYDMGHKSYALGMNEFGDLTWNEFKAKYLQFQFKRMNNESAQTFLPPLNMGDLPATVDWRKKGYVTPVKNQGQCGSCWAFSTTGSLEGQHFRKTGHLVSLSEQQLVDCSRSYGNNGCEGGLMDNGFKYIRDNGGIDTEASYPYRAVDGHCKFNRQNVGATCTGYVDIPQGDEDALKKAVATVGPVSVAIDASHSSFQLYSHGVYDEPECSSTQLDHGVLAVGYGTDSSDYWLVKNSWGPSWGLNGYIMMSRNRDNQCGIATVASYPTV